MGVGMTEGTVQQGAVGAGQQEEGEGGQDQALEQGGAEIHHDRPDIRARLRRHSDIVVADTPANRPTRVNWPPREVYQPDRA